MMGSTNRDGGEKAPAMMGIEWIIYDQHNEGYRMYHWVHYSH
jgi:hypothetical protein